LIDQRSSSLEVLDLNVNTACLLNETTDLVKLCSFLPLFHLLTNRCNFNYKILLSEITSDTEASLDVTLFDGCSSYTSVTLSIVLVHTFFFTIVCFGIDQSFLVKLLSFGVLILVLNLSCKLPANQSFFIRGQLFGKL
jgi:hypothetical protein